MDPITLSVATSGVVALASKVIEGAAGSAGESLWEAIRSKLGFTSTPPLDTLAADVAKKLLEDEGFAREILVQLQSHPETTSGQLVGRIDAEKVVIIQRQEAKNDIHNTF